MSTVRHAAMFVSPPIEYEWWDESTNQWVSTETWNTGAASQNIFAPFEWDDSETNPVYAWAVASKDDAGCEGEYSAEREVTVQVFEWWDDVGGTWISTEIFNTGSPTEEAYSPGAWGEPTREYAWAVASSDGVCTSPYSAESTVTLIDHPRVLPVISPFRKPRPRASQAVVYKSGVFEVAVSFERSYATIIG